MLRGHFLALFLCTFKLLVQELKAPVIIERPDKYRMHEFFEENIEKLKKLMPDVPFSDRHGFKAKVIMKKDENSKEESYEGRLDSWLMRQYYRVKVKELSFDSYSMEQLKKIDGNIPKMFIMTPPRETLDRTTTKVVDDLLYQTLTRLGEKIGSELDSLLVVPTKFERDLLKAIRSRYSFGLPMREAIPEEYKTTRPHYLAYLNRRMFILEMLSSLISKPPPNPLVVIASIVPKHYHIRMASDIVKLDFLIIDKDFDQDLALKVLIEEHYRFLNKRIYFGKGIAAVERIVKGTGETAFILLTRSGVHRDAKIAQEFKESISTLFEGDVDILNKTSAQDVHTTFEHKSIFSLIEVDKNFRFLVFLQRILPDLLTGNSSNSNLPGILVLQREAISGQYITDFTQLDHFTPSSLRSLIKTKPTLLSVKSTLCRSQVELVSKVKAFGSMTQDSLETNRLLGQSFNWHLEDDVVGRPVKLLVHYSRGDSEKSLILRSILENNSIASVKAFDDAAAMDCVPREVGLPLMLMIERRMDKSDFIYLVPDVQQLKVHSEKKKTKAKIDEDDW